MPTANVNNFGPNTHLYEKVTKILAADSRGEGKGVLSYIDYTAMCRWPGYGFQAFEFRTGYINQENNVGNRVYNYIKLMNSLIQVAINFIERHIATY